MKGIQTGAQVVSAIAGICIIAGATGPAAPATMLVCTAIYFAAQGADYLWGDSDEVSFLKGLGVYQKATPEARKAGQVQA